jgi:hypothetical protein
MSELTHRFITLFSMLFLALLSLLAIILFTEPATARAPEISRVSPTPERYLELAVEPSIVTPTTLITLYISYGGLGLPYTTITAEPADLIAFEPPLSMPCKFYEHPNGCTAITAQALATGTVTFRAWANGDIFDPACMCWRFTNISENEPATLMIAETIQYLNLPVIRK